MMNGCARLRFEFIKYNHHHTLTPGSWVETISVEGPYVSIKIVCFLIVIQAIHSSLTLPKSHYEYNEWLEKVEIVMWALKWSPQCVFELWLGLACIPLSTPRLSDFGPNHAFHGISTMGVCHCKHNELLHKVEI